MNKRNRYDQGAVRRRTSLALAGVLALVMALLATPAAADPSDEIDMPDKNLRICVNAQLGKGTENDDPITKVEAEGLLALACWNAGGIPTKVTDLTGMEHLKNLGVLNFSGNRISDLEPLQGLKDLKTLNLGGNVLIEAADLEALSGLTSLETLQLDSNKVDDVTHLADLPNLKALHLALNGVSDLSSFTALKSLEKLDLSFNKIDDLTPLKDLENLQALHLRDNQITDVSPLGDLTGLDQLDLPGNQITDLSPLGDLTATISAQNQTYDLGEIVIDEPRTNPVKGLDGKHLPLDSLCDDTICTTFTATDGGPTSLTWDNSSPTQETSFSGTLNFTPIEGSDDDPGDDDPGIGDPGDDDPGGDDPGPGTPPGAGDPPSDPPPNNPNDDADAEVAQAGAESGGANETGGTGGSGTLPVTGGHQTLLVFVAIILLAAGALALLFARQGRIQITPLPRD